MGKPKVTLGRKELEALSPDTVAEVEVEITLNVSETYTFLLQHAADAHWDISGMIEGDYDFLCEAAGDAVNEAPEVSAGLLTIDGQAYDPDDEGEE